MLVHFDSPREFPVAYSDRHQLLPVDAAIPFIVESHFVMLPMT